ncbi:hypothetical protein BC829DRAFT_399293 [Chytridium lagenaria]|nr:hypothetical protein BC829DRAFT_399293 [Chytridium lagenaria]
MIISTILASFNTASPPSLRTLALFSATAVALVVVGRGVGDDGTCKNRKARKSRKDADTTRAVKVDVKEDRRRTERVEMRSRRRENEGEAKKGAEVDGLLGGGVEQNCTPVVENRDDKDVEKGGDEHRDVRILILIFAPCTPDGEAPRIDSKFGSLEDICNDRVDETNARFALEVTSADVAVVKKLKPALRVSIPETVKKLKPTLRVSFSETMEDDDKDIGGDLTHCKHPIFNQDLDANDTIPSPLYAQCLYILLLLILIRFAFGHFLTTILVITVPTLLILLVLLDTFHVLLNSLSATWPEILFTNIPGSPSDFVMPYVEAVLAYLAEFALVGGYWFIWVLDNVPWAYCVVEGFLNWEARDC